jgi:hypothetical protein
MSPNPTEPEPDEPGDRTAIARRHLKLGWWGLALFALLGLVLEGLHAFKVGAYLNVDSEARRLMWRLAHAHGALLSLVNLAFALTLLRAAPKPLASLWSGAFAAATVLIPAGFFVGGVFARGADPGVGVFLVPVGAVLLIAALAAVARSI